MTPKEFKEALKQLGLTQSQFAELIDMDKMTVNRWAVGKAKISGAAAAYLRLKLKCKELT